MYPSTTSNLKLRFEKQIEELKKGAAKATDPEKLKEECLVITSGTSIQYKSISIPFLA